MRVQLVELVDNSMVIDAKSAARDFQKFFGKLKKRVELSHFYALAKWFPFKYFTFAKGTSKTG